MISANRLKQTKGDGQVSSGGLEIFLRIKPNGGGPTVLRKHGNKAVVTTLPGGGAMHTHAFTWVFTDESQKDLFDCVALPTILDSMRNRRDGVIFAYGAPNSGIRYTTQGDAENPGLVYLTLNFILDKLIATKNTCDDNKERPKCKQNNLEPTSQPLVELHKTESTEVKRNQPDRVLISLVELCGNKIVDLLDDQERKFEDREEPKISFDRNGGAYVMNVIEIDVKSKSDLTKLYDRYTEKLKIEANRGNIVINIKLVHDKSEDKSRPDQPATSRIAFVELTCEIGDKTEGRFCTGDSLRALGECIAFLRDKQQLQEVVGYRDYLNELAKETCIGPVLGRYVEMVNSDLQMYNRTINANFALIHLFKTHLEGTGNVCLLLCVNPSVGNFADNSATLNLVTRPEKP